MQLAYRQWESEIQASPLVMLHGLFGSSVNFNRVAKALSLKRPVIVPDLRNHGKSPHDRAMDYPAMAEDVYGLLSLLKIDRFELLGHSMGGKTAMIMAMSNPEKINKLIIADISPVTYQNRFSGILSAMNSIDLVKVKTRKEADELLSASIPEAAVRSYLLQNLQLSNGKWSWRINLSALIESIETLVSFPEETRMIENPTLFLKGSRSDYIDSRHINVIEKLFLNYRIRQIDHAGHWLYAEQPEMFVQQVEKFLQHD